MNPKNNPRYQAIQTLLAVLPTANTSETHSGKSLSLVFPRQSEQLSPGDKSLASHICYGVLRHYYFLAALADMHLQKPLKKKDRDIYLLIQAACYELLFSDKPAHAIVSESVELCNLLNKSWAKALVNAILRKILRTDHSVEQWLTTLLSLQKSSQAREQLLFNHPLWMIEKLKQQWPLDYQNILEANNQQAPMVLRVNALHCSGSDYLALLLLAGISGRLSTNTQNCIYLDQACNVSDLPNFEKGWVSVQDEAAQQAAWLLASQEHNNVLDACSAPGGKAAHLLELQNSIALTCVDNNASRLEKVNDNLSRLHFNAKVICSDVCALDQWWDGQFFDRILLDAPCSASGIIRRHPDIKHLRSADDVNKLAALQLQMLETLWTTLSTHGFLLYATCSVFKEENQDVITAFLQTQKNASLELLNTRLGMDFDFGRQLFPEINSHDGFFFALLKKQ